jgi:hypothetical protein
VSAWQFRGVSETPKQHVEQLAMENVQLATRNYQ